MLPISNQMRIVWLALALIGVAFLVLTGPAGFSRGPHPGNDTAIYVYGGRAMSEGLDPYAIQVQPTTPLGKLLADDCCFVNTPNFLPIAQMLGLAGPRTAYIAVTVVNFLALAGLVLLFTAMLGRERGPSDLDRIVVLGLVALSPFAANVIFLGQVTLLNAFGMFAALYFCRADRRPVLAGLALSIALFKPTMSIFVVVWLLLEREFACLAVAAAISLALSACAFLRFGPIDLTRHWLAVADLYASAGWNMFASKEMTGVNALLDALRIGEIPVIPIGVAATFGVWLMRARFTALELLGLLCGITALFGRLHNYDLVVVLPLSVALRPRRIVTAEAVLWVIATALLYVPQRLLLVAAWPALAEWRVVVIAGMMIWLLLRQPSYRGMTVSAGSLAPVMTSSTT